MASTKAGWSEIDSTPPLGLPMGGRGPRFSPGTEVLDPLAAQAVVIEDGKGQRTLWMSIDMIGMAWQTTSGFRQELSAMTGIPFEAIVINFSHTHSGPMSGFEGYATTKPKPPELDAYESDLMTRCIKMAIDAVDQMRDVRVTVHRGSSDIGINRRRQTSDGEMGMGPNPDGHYNSDLWVLSLEAASGDDRCVLFNYGCHPVMVYGFAWDGISADFPGVCRGRLVSELGPNIHAQFIQGFAGNVRPRQLADLENASFRKSIPKDVVATGSQLADDVLSALSLDGAVLSLDLSFASDFAMTPRDSALPDLSHWESLAESDEELDRNLGIYWRDRLRSGIPPVQFLPWAVGLIRLAPGHTIAWMANEVLAEWLPLLREWLKEPGLVGWGYCQDGRNYMPTDALIGEGGYEVDRANTYSKNGPGPVAVGINEVTKEVFEKLAARVG
jgi:neutral ceramidase